MSGPAARIFSFEGMMPDWRGPPTPDKTVENCVAAATTSVAVRRLRRRPEALTRL